jgi:hypothetical protein
MAPGIVSKLLANQGRLRVLDPMSGSGTVLAVARAHGHRAIGFDIDPLAVLLADVWTRAIDRAAVREAAIDVLARARHRAEALNFFSAYPPGADNPTRAFLRYWFDTTAREQLTALAAEISALTDVPVRQVLWCGFSRCIIAKQAGASRAMDLSHSRPHRAYTRAPALPFTKFLDAVERVATSCLDRKKRGNGPAASVQRGDARALPLPDGSIDVVLTSPPYLNAIDYMRCSKFSLVWMGYSVPALRSVRSVSVGTEVGQKMSEAAPEVIAVLRRLRGTGALPTSVLAMLTRYITDMRQAVSEVHRVLVDGGKASYVIGDNTIQGTFISNSTIVSAVARQCGLRLLRRSTRTLPANRRYLPPPGAQSQATALNARMAREVVLTFQKPTVAAD